MDFTEAMRRHLHALGQEGLKEKTITNHAHALKQYNCYLNEQGLDWTQVTPDEFQTYMAGFSTRHTPASTRNRRIFLTKFYMRAVRCKWISRAPMDGDAQQRSAILRFRATHLSDDENDDFLPAIDEFGDYLLAKGKSELTAKNYSYLLLTWRSYLIAQGKVWTDVELRDIERFLSQYRQSRAAAPRHSKQTGQQGKGQRSATTVALMATCLRSFYRWAARMGHIAVSPAADIDQTRRDKPLPRGLPSHTLRELLDKLNNPPASLDAEELEEWRRNRMIVLTLLFTGLRLSECARLTWEAIDWDRNEIFLPARKNGKEQYIPLNPHLKRELIAWQRGAVSGPVFLSRRTGRLTDEGISEMFRRFVQGKLGVICTAHQLRHTCAIALCEQGADLELIRMLLGHESLRTTQIYLHRIGKELHGLVARLPESWCGESSADGTSGNGNEEEAGNADTQHMTFGTFHALSGPQKKAA